MAKDYSDYDYVPRVPRFTSKKIVLVIDDEPEILDVVRSSLSDEKELRVIVASSAEEAIVLLKRFSVDAVLLDIQMPTMSGLDFLEHIRSLGYATPFVLMSGNVDQERSLKAIRLGVLDILEKPFSISKLRESILYATKVGSAIRRVQSDFQKFCSDRELDRRYVDILSYMGIFLAQEEQRRFTQETLRSFESSQQDNQTEQAVEFSEVG